MYNVPNTSLLWFSNYPYQNTQDAADEPLGKHNTSKEFSQTLRILLITEDLIH